MSGLFARTSLFVLFCGFWFYEFHVISFVVWEGGSAGRECGKYFPKIVWNSFEIARIENNTRTSAHKLGKYFIKFSSAKWKKKISLSPVSCARVARNEAHGKSHGNCVTSTWNTFSFRFFLLRIWEISFAMRTCIVSSAMTSYFGRTVLRQNILSPKMSDVERRNQWEFVILIWVIGNTRKLKP